MNFLILNGNPDGGRDSLDLYLAALIARLEQGGNKCKLLNLREMNLRYCTGCFGCWVKTPGRCHVQDGSEIVCREMLQNDLVIWASPMKMGFPGELIKRSIDKSIPLIHPYFEVVHGEAHHRARYERYPLLGLLLEKEDDTDEEDLRLVQNIFSRAALNLKSRLAFCMTCDQPVDEVASVVINSPATSDVLPTHPSPTSGCQVDPPRRLTLFNGSPRGRKGNTPVLLEQFATGFCSIPGRSAEIYHLIALRQLAERVQDFANAECAWIGFPLYADAMPASVKAFFEALQPLAGRPGNPPVGFLVQSGFPESVHSRHVEQYLERLAGRLGSPYLGTILKGGCEGTRLMPEKMNKRLFRALQQLGRGLANHGRLEPGLLAQVARPEYCPSILVPVFKLLIRTSIFSFYWDRKLKQNGAYEKRFDRPYGTPG